MKNRLQELRWQKNWTQNQLSYISGVNRSTISLLEIDITQNPTVETALRLARAFGVSVEDIFTLE